jgi:hypothetical protein
MPSLISDLRSLISPRVGVLLAAICCAACGEPIESNVGQAFDPERPWRQPGDVIDSILPMEEYERRFRQGMSAVTAFTGGAPDREALVRSFLSALERSDTLALARLAVNRAEFSWLVFPDHLYRRPPYELDPGVFWMQIQMESAKGRARLLERVVGQRLTFRRLDCQRDTLQFRQGPIVAWAPCMVEYATADSTHERRLFGTIVERDGVAKFLGYGNDF